MERTCEVCGASFTTRPAVVRAGNGRFCSQSCFQETQRNAVTRQCERCGTTFTTKAVFAARSVGRFCSKLCFDDSRRRVQRVANVRHRTMKAKGHPIAPPSGIAPIARVLLYDAIGPGWHPCHWCQRKVEWRVGSGVRDPDALLVDHVDHDAANDELSNLVPSCNTCNAHRRKTGDSALLGPDDVVAVSADGSRTRGVERACETCGASFVARASQVRIGKGRFCCRSCARRANRSV